MQNSGIVGVVDVGSNTIKMLAARAEQGLVLPVAEQSFGCRISQGISKDNPELQPKAIERGVDAILNLVDAARKAEAEDIIVTATSAVRDARNGGDFRDTVKNTTGLDLRILSGTEEAIFIGRGVAADPALAEHSAFYISDIGGGSMEFLDYRDGEVRQAISLPLGAVRMTERFVSDPTAPFDERAIEDLEAHTLQLLTESGFDFSTPMPYVGTGGAVRFARMLLANERNAAYKHSPFIGLGGLKQLFRQLAFLTLDQRMKVPLLPKHRADILPAALLVLLTVAEHANIDGFIHTDHNLRYGVAVDWLTRRGLL